MSTFFEREKRRRSKRRMGRREYVVLIATMVPLFLAKSAFDSWVEQPWEIERAGVLWGEESNGLRVGIECIGPETPEAGWRCPAFKFHMRNEGDAPAVLLGVHERFNSTVTVPLHRDQIRVLYSDRLSGTGQMLEQRLVPLAPGEEIVAGEPFAFHLGLSLLGNREKVINLSFVYEWREPDIESVPDYRMTPTKVRAWTGRVETPAITMWRGLPTWLSWVVGIGYCLFAGTVVWLVLLFARWRWPAHFDKAEAAAAESDAS